MSPAPCERRITPPASLTGLRGLWLCTLDDLDIDDASMLRALTPEESTRASAFRHDVDRVRFLRRRWYCRHVIARSVGAAVDDIRMAWSDLGQPTIVAPASAMRLSLSTAHRAGVGIVALAEGVDVGVDLERVDAAHATFDAAAVFMTPRELNEWSVSLDAPREAGFHRIWTRKEAVLKTLGTGFGTDPRSVDVRDNVIEIAESRIRIADIDVGDGYAGAAAVRTF